ncbi:MAG TPA: serine/threonine-protein kinase [Polyangiaceae bacterium]|nr:serine/threonine-protein kinase [Polyangiaceae bacterium]
MTTEDAPGRIVGGRYELVDVLGRGGMAVVWRALQRGAVGFARPVALKRVVPALARSPEALSLFAEEARVGALLRHPNIVALLDYAHDEQGEPYLVSELVEGMHLGDWMRAHARAGIDTPWELVAAIGIEVLRGLDAAHSRLDVRGQPATVLHRDVTPSNILLDETGIVKLADFGLARAMDRERITRPDVVKGKAAYLAPEVVRGAPPSPQSDIFGVGIVLWEALSGLRLFAGENEVKSALLVRDAMVPMLGTKRAGVPLQILSTVHRALERDPGRRFRSALDMMSALRDALRVLPYTTDATALAASVRGAQTNLTQTPRDGGSRSVG